MENADGQKIKVCFVSPKSYPLFERSAEGVFGGAEVDLYMLGTELAKDGNFEVSFVAADYGQDDERQIEGVRVVKSLDFDRNSLVGAIRIWRALKRADADIYVIKTASPGVPLVAMFCRLKRRAFVYRTAHKRECDGTYLKEHFVLGRAFAWSLRRARKVFAQNVSDAEGLKETIGVESVVVANGHRLGPVGESERDSILWVGRSAEFKRPEKFIALARKFAPERFVMICQRATGDKDYEQLVRKVKIVPNIEFHERVGFDKIDGFFVRAKVFVNTSDAEGFANTFIQACRAGTAILSLNVNPDNFLDKFGCGVCCGGSVDKLAQELKVMLEEDSYGELGRNGRKYAEENHDIAKIVERYKEIFSELGVKKSGD
jgi:glycosyltransferase involved in cell wall biosynthesis